MALLARLSTALLGLPLLLCGPVLRVVQARERRRRLVAVRRAGAATQRSTGGTESVPAARLSGEAMRAMRDELRRALAVQAAAGRSFAHLARFAHKLSRVGLRAVDDVPVEQLRRALADFEAMVRNWSSPALADLRSRMAVALADRSSASSMWIAVNSVAPSYRQPPHSMAARLARTTVSAFRSSQQLSIGEVSLSHFEAAGGRRAG